MALAREPRLIIDGGANVRFAAVLLANNYPKSRILAVEPHRENAIMMQLNCRHYPNVELITSAIWSSKRRLEIANPNCHIHGAFQVSEAFSVKGPNTFEGITITDLFHRANEREIDLLKLDIEGEKLVFERAGWKRDTNHFGRASDGQQATSDCCRHRLA